MRPSTKFSVGLLAIYLGIISSCTKEATEAKEEETAIDPCAYEEQFSSIQVLIDAASPGDTILIEPGTYEGTINFQGKDVVVGSLFLTTGDSSYISQTILDAKQSGSVVRFENSEGSGSVLSGVTLTGGYAVEGGGIYISSASPTLNHLRITGNHAYNCEEGDYFRASSGGGIYMEGADPNISKVMISENSSESRGGGISMTNAHPSFHLVTVTMDTAMEGGGIHAGVSSPSLSRVVVTENVAEKGAGFYLTAFSNPELVNTVVGDNTASVEGGGLFVDNSEVNFVNVTVARNTALSHGGSIFMNGGVVKILNSILYSADPEEIWYNSTGSSSTMTLRYTDVEGGLEGIETNSNGTVDWREGNLDIGHGVRDNYCQEGPVWGADEKFHPPSAIIDAGDPASKYNDEENLWCIYVNMAEEWASNPAVISTPDSTTVRNDLGAFGGPKGSWGIIHATPGSEW